MSTPPRPGGSGPQPRAPAPGRPGMRWIWISMILWIGLALGVSHLVGANASQRVRVPYEPFFLNQVQAGNVGSISANGTSIEGTLRYGARYVPPGGSAETVSDYVTEVPVFADRAQLSALLRSRHVTVAAQPTGGSSLVSVLLGLLPVLLIAGFFLWMIRRAGAGGAGGGFGAAAFGRSKARRVEASTESITFRDVAGVDEAKAELAEMVDFLKRPDKYRRLGGHVPRGVLLTGPPGTGKTLLARALAGEAAVPFFSISASEFVELYVGVGASRVRDLFAQAKQAAPAIVFIDELDAIGRSRASRAGGFGGSDEREQTLNQILTEMDGFDASTGVIVLAATNKPDILDAALLRPGRFDRRVAIQPPDTAGRRAILDVHTRSVPLAPDVDLDQLAATTTGMVGADLANVVNEGALMAARRGHERVAMDDLDEALEKLVLGTERRIMLTPQDRRRIAYHEAGHAVLAMLNPAADPVRKVSIVPHGAALGVTLAAPAADRFNYDRPYFDAKLEVALGGRAAEELVFPSVSTGAQDDIRTATQLARDMVGRWGMSEAVGPIAVLDDEAGARWPLDEVAPATRELVDREVRKLVDGAHDRALMALSERRDALDGLAAALLAHETLDERAAHEAAGVAAVRTHAEAEQDAPLERSS